MKINLFLILLTLIFSIKPAQSQNDVLMTIDSQEITSEEFLRVYNKNNSITPESDKKDINEYLELFVNYKLKVIEAENLGYDTLKSFSEEFSGYREQLAKPYLENTELKEDLVTEAYERYKYEIEASHILVSCEEFASPEDTLKAYNKLSAIRARVVGGEPFDEVARATSDDPSVKNNAGYLGYFSVFRMVYPFETTAYNTPKGKVSKITRTSFGYHLINVSDIRENRGSIKTAHIMTRIAADASDPEKQAAFEKINKAYTTLMNGMTWSEAVAEFSENPSTKTKDGEIGWLRSGQAPDEFLNPCFELEIGQFTKPIETKGGYHIGYVLDKKPIETFEEAKEKLTNQVSKDKKRHSALKDLQYSELKRKYKLLTFPDNLNSIISIVDSSIYDGTWSVDNYENLGNKILQIEDKEFYQSDFVKYLLSKKVKISKSLSPEANVRSNFEEYSNGKLYSYAMQMLPEENDDYKYLLKEYHDGILLFNLTNDLVWSKAQEDSAGLAEFYQTAEKYKWNERIMVTVYEYKDNSFTSQLPALIKKQNKKNLGNEFLIKNLCPNDSTPCISSKKKVYEKGQDAMGDKLRWETNSYIVESNESTNYLYFVTEVKGVADKALSEARGLYISDYQSFLETEWIKKLREKYEVSINEEILQELK